jgi:hypothetical protein
VEPGGAAAEACPSEADLSSEDATVVASGRLEDMPPTSEAAAATILEDCGL